VGDCPFLGRDGQPVQAIVTVIGLLLQVMRQGLVDAHRNKQARFARALFGKARPERTAIHKILTLFYFVRYLYAGRQV